MVAQLGFRLSRLVWGSPPACRVAREWLRWDRARSFAVASWQRSSDLSHPTTARWHGDVVNLPGLYQTYNSTQDLSNNVNSCNQRPSLHHSPSTLLCCRTSRSSMTCAVRRRKACHRWFHLLAWVHLGGAEMYVERAFDYIVWSSLCKALAATAEGQFNHGLCPCTKNRALKLPVAI